MQFRYKTHDLGHGWSCITCSDGSMSIQNGKETYYLNGDSVDRLRHIMNSHNQTAFAPNLPVEP